MTAFCLSRFMTTVVPRAVAFDRQYEETEGAHKFLGTKAKSNDTMMTRPESRRLSNQLHIESLHFHAIDFGPGGGHGGRGDGKRRIEATLQREAPQLYVVLNLTRTKNDFS